MFLLAYVGPWCDAWTWAFLFWFSSVFPICAPVLTVMRPRQTRHSLCQDRLDIMKWWAAVRLFNHLLLLLFIALSRSRKMLFSPQNYIIFLGMIKKQLWDKEVIYSVILKKQNAVFFPIQVSTDSSSSVHISEGGSELEQNIPTSPPL